MLRDLLTDAMGYSQNEVDGDGSECGWPVLICLLGEFRILNGGHPMEIHGAKMRALLSILALQTNYVMPREALLETLWPNVKVGLAGQSLSSLLHSLRKAISPQIGGEPLVRYADGCYRLNVAVGLATDVDLFEESAREGEQASRLGNPLAAADAYARAIHLYRGDLCAVADANQNANDNSQSNAALKREHLKSSYLTLLARLAEHYYGQRNYWHCIEVAHRLLAKEPCREDVHRLLMRCYVLRGERSQAFRHYRLCLEILRREFDAEPEEATVQLFDQIRLAPENIRPDHKEQLQHLSVYGSSGSELEYLLGYDSAKTHMDKRRH
jgi:DNA-binding SARP family transcriptional activator